VMVTVCSPVEVEVVSAASCSELQATADRDSKIDSKRRTRKIAVGRAVGRAVDRTSVEARGSRA